MEFKEKNLSDGTHVILGKDAEQNEKLVKQYMGKENIILHTAEPGSPFCVIDNLKPLLKEIKEAAIYCALFSQDWRDNKVDVKIHIFTGKDVYKRKGMKEGTFGIKKYKLIKVKKKILKNANSKKYSIREKKSYR